VSQYNTEFATIQDYTKGSVTIISKDNKKNYVYSNMYEVAAKSAPFERVAIAKNFEYVVESMRAEGTSNWYSAAHDEFAVAMDFPVKIEFLKLDDPDTLVDPESEGAHKLVGTPAGKKMGNVKLGRGHMALLPVGSAYRFIADEAATVMIQTIDGPETLHKWSEFCEQ